MIIKDSLNKYLYNFYLCMFFYKKNQMKEKYKKNLYNYVKN